MLQIKRGKNNETEAKDITMCCFLTFSCICLKLLCPLKLALQLPYQKLWTLRIICNKEIEGNFSLSLYFWSSLWCLKCTVVNRYPKIQILNNPNSTVSSWITVIKQKKANKNFFKKL